MVQQLLLRIITVALGALGIIWGASLLPRFWQAASLNEVAVEIVQGHVFTRKAMTQEALRAEPEISLPLCYPTELHNAVVLHLAMLNDDLAKKNQSLVEQSDKQLHELGRNALACAPSDGFTWLTLFWIDAAKHSVRSDNITYLRLSYALSPNEGWIGLWRNRLVMAAFDRLPSDVQTDGVDEFVKLLDTDRQYEEMAAIFAAAGPTAQMRIAEALRDVNDTARQIFARLLRDKGLDVRISGVERPERPWR